MVRFCAESRRLSKAASEFPGLFGVEEWEEEEEEEQVVKEEE